MSMRWVDLANAKSKEGHGKKFESILSSNAVIDFGQEGVLGSGFDVCGGLEGTDCALH